MAWLNRRSFGVRTALHQAASVLSIERRGDPLSAAKFSTLRRMTRKAEKLGITCRIVPEEERDGVLAEAIAFEKNHPDPRYRRAEPKTADLRGVALWIAANSASGEPLVLSVTPVSGNAALLRYLRTLSTGEKTTLARYALTAELVRQLNKRRVRYLVDNVSPISVSSTLRHFATMVGFRIVRVDMRVRD